MKLTLVIEVLESGKVEVTGPLSEQVLCLGLLEMAKQNVIEWNKKNQAASGFSSHGIYYEGKGSS